MQVSGVYYTPGGCAGLLAMPTGVGMICYYDHGLHCVASLLCFSPSRMRVLETKDPVFLGFALLAPHTGLLCAQ